MSKFKKLVLNQIITEAFDKDARFLIDHGINPILLDKRIPLYYPETGQMIKVVGVDKKSPYFKQNDFKQGWDVELTTFPEDSLIIIPFSEERNAEKNVYVGKENEKIIIPVEKFKDEIYDHPMNYDTTSDFEISPYNTNVRLDSPEDKEATRLLFKQNLDQKALDDELEFSLWKKNYFRMNPSIASEVEKIKNPKKQTELLKTLRKLDAQGYEDGDIIIDFTIWSHDNNVETVISAIKEQIKQKIDALYPTNKTEALAAKKAAARDFTEFLQELYIDEIISEPQMANRVMMSKLLKRCKSWLKDYFNKTTQKEESVVITEFRPTNNPNGIPRFSLMYGKKGQDKRDLENELEKRGIPKKHLTVPFIIRAPWNSQRFPNPDDDPMATPTMEVIIKGFPDLNNKPEVLAVKDLRTNESFEMGVEEVKENLSSEWNTSPEKQALLNLRYLNPETSELDTVGYFTDPHHTASLNRGIGTYKELPEEVILATLEYAEKQNRIKYPNVVKKYKLSKGNKLVLTTLKDHSTQPVRYSEKQNIYQIFVPYEDKAKIRPPKNPNRYTSIFNYNKK